MAKTPYSFSADPNLRGAASDHTITIRDVRLSRGAEFLVVLCGDIMTMPGLPKKPASELIDVAGDGVITGSILNRVFFMKSILRSLFSPILIIFEKGDDAYA